MSGRSATGLPDDCQLGNERGMALTSAAASRRPSGLSVSVREAPSPTYPSGTSLDQKRVRRP